MVWGLVRVQAWAQALELEPTLALVAVLVAVAVLPSPLTQARASALVQRRWPARLVHRYPRYRLVPCLKLVRRSSLPCWPHQRRRRALGAVRSLRPRQQQRLRRRSPAAHRHRLPMLRPQPPHRWYAARHRPASVVNQRRMTLKIRKRQKTKWRQPPRLPGLTATRTMTFNPWPHAPAVPSHASAVGPPPAHRRRPHQRLPRDNPSVGASALRLDEPLHLRLLAATARQRHKQHPRLRKTPPRRMRQVCQAAVRALPTRMRR